MSIEIRDAKPEDLDYCRKNGIDEDMKVYPNWDLTGWTKTMLIDGEIVGIGGIVIYWQGMGEGWICVSKNIEKHPVKSVLRLKNLLMEVLKELDLRRLQVAVRFDFAQAIKLVQALGFEKECLMKKYLPGGKNAWLYSIVR